MLEGQKGEFDAYLVYGLMSMCEGEFLIDIDVMPLMAIDVIYENGMLCEDLCDYMVITF